MRGARGPHSHAHGHGRGHHGGSCGPSCRSGMVSHHHRSSHLYRGSGTRGRERRAFERRYGKRKGDYVYGATVGKVRRERMARRRRR